MDFAPLLIAAAMVAVIIDIVRSARGGDWNGVITPLAAAVAGIVIAWLLGESDFGAGVPVGDTGETFASVNGASLVLLGFALGSIAAKGVDTISAIAKRPNVKPALVPGSNNHNNDGA